jgi:fructose-specific phosphotransferase system component IIB
MITENDNKAAFIITIGDIQVESARLIGRKLTDLELYTAIKDIDSGLSFDINTVFKTAIEDAVDKNRNINELSF